MLNIIYDQFCELLNPILEKTLYNNIIIYGANRGGEFIKWYYQHYFKKRIEVIIDRWAISPISTIPHLFTLYYIYNENDVIINITPHNIREEFEDTGENWNRVQYRDSQIINLWDIIYGEGGGIIQKELQVTFYDWLEFKFGVDLLNTIKRKYVTGEGAHGYYPTDFRVFIDGLEGHQISEEDAVLDIGCGKGSSIIAFHVMGFNKIGAVEYTDSIYKILDDNLNKLSVKHQNNLVGEYFDDIQNEIILYQGDASILKKELDRYNYFFLFNPFSWEITETVIQNICESIDRRQRKVYILYAEPIGHQLIMKTNRFMLKKSICNDYSEATYFSYLYESINKS